MSVLKPLLLASAATVASLSLAAGVSSIAPGDRLKVVVWGPGYSASQLSVVDSNGMIRLGERTAVRLRGLSTNAAAKALCASLYISDGKTNPVREASVRKIAPLPLPLGLAVLRSDTSNLVFRLTNVTSNSVRLPSAGYVPSDMYIPINTNPAYARFERPEAEIGLWLTRDWRHVGLDWMRASPEAWRDRLRIQELKPGDQLDVTRSLGPFAEEITTNTVLRFNFQISQEWAEQYGLWEGNISVTGLTKEPAR